MKIEPFNFPDFDIDSPVKGESKKKGAGVPDFNAVEEFGEHVHDPTVTLFCDNIEKHEKEKAKLLSQSMEHEDNSVLDSIIQGEAQIDLKTKDGNRKIEGSASEAFQKGYDQGFTEGHNKAKDKETVEIKTQEEQEQKELEENIAHAIISIEQEVKQKVIAHDDTINQMKEDTRKLATAISNKLVNKLLTQNALNIIDNVINEVFPMLVDEPKIVVTLHKKMAPQVSKRLQIMINDVDYTGKLTIKSHEEDDISSCTVSWEGGIVEYNMDSIYNKIEELLK
jgi:flagellar biosynthesis/type III secretory pathway protein FliH